MRILHTSDWHLGSRLYGFDRADELFGQVEQVCRIIEAEHVDVLLVAGDIFERGDRARLHESTKRLAQMLKPLIERGLRVILVPGNHDYRDHFRMMSALLDLKKDHTERIRIVQKMELFEMNNVQFAVLPYPELELLAKLGDRATLADKVGASERNQSLSVTLSEVVRDLIARLNPSRPSIFVTHIQVEGVTTPSQKELTYHHDIALSRQSLPTNVSYIALGHIHQAQPIEHVVPCWYSGSFDRMDLGEREDKKFVLLVDVPEVGPAAVTDYEIEATPFGDLSITSAELESYAADYANRERTYVRINLECSPGDDTIALQRRAKELFTRCTELRLTGSHLSMLATNTPANPTNYTTTVLSYLDQVFADDPDLPVLRERAQKLIREVNDALATN
jgi:DNA repair protein SbcD/Mre11